MFLNYQETFEIVGNLHVNFTIAVYSPTNITFLFYPVSKFSYFCIYNTPLNCYYFTHQSQPFAVAHLTSFRRLQNSPSKSVCLCAHLTLYPATDCAAATDISDVSGS